MADFVREIYTFEGFRLDVSEHLLSRNGEPLTITPKAFDLLVLLVRNQGHLLTKDEIIEKLWAGSFVEEANLNVNISALRRVLGDTAADQRFIETVPRQGYRFVVSVTKEGSDPVHRPRSAETARDEPHQVFQRLRPVRILAVVAILALVPLGLWAVYKLVVRSDERPRSIAVLPFRPLAQSASDEALEMGMTDALITRLSKIEQLVVRPTSAVRQYTTGASDALEAGRQLRVDAVLDGKIQRSENRVRATVQLIRVNDGATLWSDSFDDYFSNIFALQDSISERMANSLAVKLSRKQQETVEKRYTESTEAYQLFLQAQHHHLQISEEGSRTALKYYQAAVEQDPQYALAWASMVGAYAHLENLNEDREGNRERARNAAYRALAIDPELPEAHEAVATVVDFFEWNWPEAEKEYLRAIELGPRREGPHYAYSIFLSRFKRHDEALREIRIASQIDPTAVYIQDQLARTLFRAGRFDEALGELKKSLEMKPDGSMANSILLRIYIEMAKHPEAEALMDRMTAVGSKPAESVRARLYLLTGRRAEAEKILRPLIANYRDGDNAWQIAQYHVYLGELDEAFELLEKAFQRREAHIMTLNIEPEWAPLRNDERYANLMRRMRVPL